jgi:hypothetical protein
MVLVEGQASRRDECYLYNSQGEYMNGRSAFHTFSLNT